MEEEIQSVPVPPFPFLPLRPLVICALAAGILAALYVGLCLYVALGGRVLPGVWMGGELNVGGMRQTQAAQVTQDYFIHKFQAVSLSLACGENGGDLNGSCVRVDGAASARNACRVGRAGSPAGYGLRFLSGLFRRVSVPPTIDDSGLDVQLTQLLAPWETAPVETACAVDGKEIRMVKGREGLRYQTAAARSALLDAILAKAGGRNVPEPIRLEPEPVPPAAVDWAALARQVAAPPADAYLDPETLEIVPSVTGVSLDTARAQTLYAAAGPGESIVLPLLFTPPDMTAEQLNAILFRDLLGEAVSQVSGSAPRKENVRLAAELINGTILLPEGIFSYNDCTGPRTADHGFRPAPSYVNGLTVEEVGGGICQVSSTAYCAALQANLSILERQNHSFAVGYVPDGLDATVYYGTLDFRFRNDTAAPVRLTAECADRDGARWLTVKIYGAKRDDTYVKMESSRVSTTGYRTVYKPDPAVPAGTTKVSVTPHTGRKVETYRCVYGADGSLLSRTLEAVSNYKKRDKVVLCNPADAYLYDSSAPKPTPAVSPAPKPTPTL